MFTCSPLSPSCCDSSKPVFIEHWLWRNDLGVFPKGIPDVPILWFDLKVLLLASFPFSLIIEDWNSFICPFDEIVRSFMKEGNWFNPSDCLDIYDRNLYWATDDDISAIDLTVSPHIWGTIEPGSLLNLIYSGLSGEDTFGKSKGFGNFAWWATVKLGLLLSALTFLLVKYKFGLFCICLRRLLISNP